jgi:hypothetical protein
MTTATGQIAAASVFTESAHRFRWSPAVPSDLDFEFTAGSALPAPYPARLR